MKKFFVTLGIIMIAKFAHCADNYWKVNPSAYEFNMNVTASVYIDDVEQQDANLEIGVFYGEELRGSALPRLSPLVSKYIYDLTIYSDETCNLSFKLYDHNTNTVSDLVCEQILTFDANGTEGNAFNPYVINFVTPTPAITFTGDGSWSETSNWLNSIMPTVTDDVVIDGNAFISEEVTVNSLAINEGKSITIQNGGVFNVTGELVNTDYDALIIEDGGQIIQTNEDVAATFKKNIVNPSLWSNPVSGWQFISSPMIDAATEGFVSTEGDYDLYKFDGEEDLQWINYKNHDDFEDTFTSGIGYIASYEKQNVATFQGTLNNETEYFDFGISYNSNNEWANFYLLGNPFSFDIDWELMDAYRIEDGFATLDANTGAYIYNVEGYIKVGEGFLVCASRKNAALEYIASAKSRSADYEYINIIASGKGASDNVIVRFGENESIGFPKIENINPDVANVYVKNDNIRYGIFNCDAELKEIPLCFDAKEMGKYTINVNVSGEFNNVILVDRMTGIETNLLIEDYTFTSRSNDDKERFILKLGNSQQSTDNGHFAYQSGEELIIDAEGIIQIVDMMGRTVITEENHDEIINICGLKKSTYIVRCVNENEVKTQKIVVL